MVNAGGADFLHAAAAMASDTETVNLRGEYVDDIR
jgi:hypothetical protein